MLNKSLIRQVSGVGSEPRFSMLETIRSFAWDEMCQQPEDEVEALWQRYADFFTELVEVAPSRDKAVQWMPIRAQEYENLRNIRQWATASGNHRYPLRIAGGMFRYWQVIGHTAEGIEWQREALENNPEAPAGLRGRVMLGYFIVLTGTGRILDKAKVLEECRGLLETAGDKEGLAIYFNLSGITATEAGDFHLAIHEHETALKYIKEVGRHDLEAMNLINLGQVYLELDDFEEGRTRFIQALKISEQIQSSPDIYWSSYQLARISFNEQSYKEARTYLSKSFTHIEKLRSNWGAGVCLPLLGYVEILDGDVDRGLQLIGFADAARQILEMGSNQNMDEEQSHHLRIAAEKIGEARVQKALQVGRKLEFTQALEQVKSLI